MAAFLGKVDFREGGIWQVEITVRCPFGRKPDKTYNALTDDDGQSFIDSSSGQPIVDASLVGRLRDRVKYVKSSTGKHIL